MNRKVKHTPLWTIFFGILSLAWLFPIAVILYNSFKTKAYISSTYTFQLPNSKSFAGLDNYTLGVARTGFMESFGWTAFITVGSVFLILLCTSMCAWWIVRVNNWFAKFIYTLFLFNMIVPFQMVMFPLVKIADVIGFDLPDDGGRIGLNQPYGLWFIYLGFGAGLAGGDKEPPLRDRGSCHDRRCKRPLYILRHRCAADAAQYYQRGYPGDHVDMERLSSPIPHPSAGNPDDPYCRPIP